jgi:hypothetical protein
VSAAGVKKYLKLIDQAALAIDEQLLPDFIGGYELGAIYIEWRRNAAELSRVTGIKLDRRGSQSKQLSKFMGALLDHPVQFEFAESIIAYVDSL